MPDGSMSAAEQLPAMPSPDASGFRRTETQRQESRARYHALKLVVDGQLASETAQRGMMLDNLRKRLGSEQAALKETMLVPGRQMEKIRAAIQAEQARREDAKADPTVEITEEYVNVPQAAQPAESPGMLAAKRRTALAGMEPMELDPLPRPELPSPEEMDTALDQIQEQPVAAAAPAASPSPRKRLADVFARKDKFKDSLNRSA